MESWGVAFLGIFSLLGGLASSSDSYSSLHLSLLALSRLIDRIWTVRGKMFSVCVSRRSGSLSLFRGMSAPTGRRCPSLHLRGSRPQRGSAVLPFGGTKPSLENVPAYRPTPAPALMSPPSALSLCVGQEEECLPELPRPPCSSASETPPSTGARGQTFVLPREHASAEIRK